MERGVTQGEPVSPTTLNILVDAVVREVLMGVCGTQEAHHGFGWSAGKYNFFLCRWQANSGAQPDLGAYNTVRHGKNVKEFGTPDKPGKDQRNGIHTGVNLGLTGISGVEEEIDGIRVQLL